MQTITISLYGWKGSVADWIETNVSNGDIIYQWPYNDFTFVKEEDAIAFMLVFGGKRKKSKIEIMIENENLYERN